MSGEKLAGAALELVGVPFRLHGRDPATGLDCIGLAEVALARAGASVSLPTGYRLRGDGAAMLACWHDRSLQQLADGEPPAPGQIVLCKAGPAQPHLLILARGGFVHAHAGLRRVVFSPGDHGWPVIARWQMAGLCKATALPLPATTPRTKG